MKRLLWGALRLMKTKLHNAHNIEKKEKKSKMFNSAFINFTFDKGKKR